MNNQIILIQKPFKYLILLFTFFLVNSAFAQNPDLPKDEVTIYLSNGKQIRNVKLWEIYPGRIEYEQKGNLHDLPVEEISGIVSSDGVIYKIEEGKMVTHYNPKQTVPASVPAEETKSTSALTTVFSEEKPDSETTTPLVTATKTVPIPEIKTVPVPETKTLTENPGDCYTSFIRGKQAAAMPDDIENLQYFCAGCIPLYPLNILFATTTFEPGKIPAGTDARCYREGYQAGRRKKQIENLVIGGVTLWALVFVVIMVGL